MQSCGNPITEPLLVSHINALARTCNTHAQHVDYPIRIILSAIFFIAVVQNVSTVLFITSVSRICIRNNTAFRLFYSINRDPIVYRIFKK